MPPTQLVEGAKHFSHSRLLKNIEVIASKILNRVLSNEIFSYSPYFKKHFKLAHN